MNFLQYPTKDRLGNYYIRGHKNSKVVTVVLHGYRDSLYTNGIDAFTTGVRNCVFVFPIFSGHNPIRGDNFFYPTIEERTLELEYFLLELNRRFPELEKINFIGYSQGATVLLNAQRTNFKGIISTEVISNMIYIAPRVNLKSFLARFSTHQLADWAKGNPISLAQSFGKELIFSPQYFYEINNLNVLADLTPGDYKHSIVRFADDDITTEVENKSLLKLFPQADYYQIDQQRHVPDNKGIVRLGEIISAILAENSSLG